MKHLWVMVGKGFLAEMVEFWLNKRGSLWKKWAIDDPSRDVCIKYDKIFDWMSQDWLLYWDSQHWACKIKTVRHWLFLQANLFGFLQNQWPVSILWNSSPRADRMTHLLLPFACILLSNLFCKAWVSQISYQWFFLPGISSSCHWNYLITITISLFNSYPLFLFLLAHSLHAEAPIWHWPRQTTDNFPSLQKTSCKPNSLIFPSIPLQTGLEATS